MGSNYVGHVAGQGSGGGPTPFDRVRSDQQPNSDGAFVFALGPFERLERFLILGAEGGSYYASEQKLTLENAACVREAFSENPALAAGTIREISDWGRAPKVSPALFALALGASHEDLLARSAAFDVFPSVVRTGGHLLEFVHYVNALRGWGRGLRRVVGEWYANRPADPLAHQLLKYRQRQWGGERVSQRDVLRLCHVPNDKLTMRQQAVVRYVVSPESRLREREVFRLNRAGYAARGESRLMMQRQPELGELPAKLQAFEWLRTSSVEAIVLAIALHGFTHEMIPKAALSDNRVWEALLGHMPMGALVRNVSQLTARGIIAGDNHWAKHVATRIGDLGAIRKARLHPLALLSAFRVYQRGHGERGQKSWTPSPCVTGALEAGYELAMGNVQPSGGRQMVALDVSGSMQSGTIAGIPGLTPHEASIAMALVTLRAEENPKLVAFTHDLMLLDWPKDIRLGEALERTRRLQFGGTDCSLPMRWAAATDATMDGFVVYTDSETNQSTEHPYLALRRYREVSGKAAKLAVVAMLANPFSIADPRDAGMMDFVGFDTRAPSVLADFLRPRGKKRVQSQRVIEASAIEDTAED